jgi:hypothetical protein
VDAMTAALFVSLFVIGCVLGWLIYDLHRNK